MCSLGVGDVICSTSSTNYEGVKKIEVVTVFELNAYVVNSTPHVKSLTVSSSILAGATYPALMGSLPACSDLTSAGVVRYRVELCILDGTESAVFVVFYAKISWLTNVHAAEISELMGVGVGDCRGRASPHSNICDSCKSYFEIYTPPYIHEALGCLRRSEAYTEEEEKMLLALQGSICSRTASGELNSVRIIAEEQQLPGAGCPLKKARTE
ncbi:hypothetical protein YC2023_004870 [Brassica napus]